MSARGHYYDGMLDVYSDLSQFTSKLGTEFVITEFGELKYYIERSTEEEVDSKISEFGESFLVSEECSENELKRAAKTSLGLDKMVKKYQLGAFAYYFEVKGDPEYENLITSVIPGFTLMTAQNIPVAGEYEIKNVHALTILDLLGPGGSFSEFYGLDFNEGIVLLGHDGPAHFGIAEGKVGLVPRAFTNAWSQEGPSHHMAIGVGHWASTIAKVADLLGVEFVGIG